MPLQNHRRCLHFQLSIYNINTYILAWEFNIFQNTINAIDKTIRFNTWYLKNCFPSLLPSVNVVLSELLCHIVREGYLKLQHRSRLNTHCFIWRSPFIYELVFMSVTPQAARIDVDTKTLETTIDHYRLISCPVCCGWGLWNLNALTTV